MEFIDIYWNAGTRNTDLAVIQKSQQRCNQGTAVASRLGAASGGDERIQSFAKIQGQRANLRRVRKTDGHVSAWRADFWRENPRSLPTTHTVALHSADIHVFHLTILRHVRHAAVHHADIAHLWITRRPEMGHHLVECAGHFGQCDNDGHRSYMRQTVNHIDYDGNYVHQLFRIG